MHQNTRIITDTNTYKKVDIQVVQSINLDNKENEEIEDQKET